MIQLGWARLKAEGPYPLRRGAWYRIVEAHLRDVVVQVHRTAMAMPRADIDVAETPPRRWTLVPRPAKALRLPDSWGDWYLVCPSCHGRAPVHAASSPVRCPRCRVVFPVASDEHYLRDRDGRTDSRQTEPPGSTPNP